MKTAFYAAALLACSAMAISIPNAGYSVFAQNDIEADDFDYSDLAEVDSMSELEAFAGVSDDCIDNVNGIRIVLPTPDCQKQLSACKCEGFEKSMLGAMGELSCNANKLADALRKQWARSREIAAAPMYKINGELKFEPKVDPAPAPAAPAPAAPAVAPAAPAVAPAAPTTAPAIAPAAPRA